MCVISLPVLVLRVDGDVGILSWTSPSIWNGTWVVRNLDYGGTILDQFQEFVERIHKRTMTNLVAFIDRERVTSWDIGAKSQACRIRL